MNAARSGEPLDIVVVYPELLGLYGDGGNARVLAHRAQARGYDARIVEVTPGDPIPTQAGLSLIGGGEDAPMVLAATYLAEQTAFLDTLRNGATCLAVCAGFQLLSERFVGPDGAEHTGAGVLDVRCGRLAGARAVGEVVAAPVGQSWAQLSGYENHQGDAVLGSDATALGRVEAGVGNGHDAHEGAQQLGVLATYLHGPVLARNPDVADHLLARALGTPLEPLLEQPVERLRRERLREAAGLGTRRQ